MIHAVEDKRMIKRTIAACAASLALQTPANAEINVSRAASCLLTVKDFEAIRSECEFTPISRDGSFIISSYNGKYFAYVLITSKGVADGHWNAAPYATHAHTPLGTLYREDGCWVNDLASVCAY